MASIRSATTESTKSKRELDIDDLFQLFENKYETAWDELKHRIIELDNHGRRTIPSLAQSTLSPFDARQIFNFRQAEDVLWAAVDEIRVPQYLSDSIDRTLTTISSHQTNTSFSRMLVDQILYAVVYEHKRTEIAKRRASLQPQNPTIIQIQQGTHFQRQVIYGGETRLLDGYADYTVEYEPQESSSKFATHLIIIQAKESNSADTCLGQLTAYMGIAHSCRKYEHQKSSTIYGVAFDGLSFRFCRIDDEGNWSRSRLMEWKMHDKNRIYSIFRSLVTMARPSDDPFIFSKMSLRDRQWAVPHWSSRESSGITALDFCGLEIEEGEE